MKLQLVDVHDPHIAAVAHVDAFGVTIADVSGAYAAFNRLPIGKPGEPICWIRDLGGATLGMSPAQVPFLWAPGSNDSKIHTDFLAFLRAVEAECAKRREQQELIDRRHDEIEATCRRMGGDDE